MYVRPSATNQPEISNLLLLDINKLTGQLDLCYQAEGTVLTSIKEFKGLYVSATKFDHMVHLNDYLTQKFF